MAPSEKNGRLKHFGSVQLLMSFIVGGMLFLFYMWFYVFVLGADLPKTAILKLQNAIWSTRMDQMSKQLDRYDQLLSLMEMRDNRIYRSVYGLDEIPQAVPCWISRAAWTCWKSGPTSSPNPLTM